jgi:hypothetical protein
MPPIPVCVVVPGVELMADIAEPECELVPGFWLAIDIEDEAAMLSNYRPCWRSLPVWISSLRT